MAKPPKKKWTFSARFRNQESRSKRTDSSCGRGGAIPRESIASAHARRQFIGGDQRLKGGRFRLGGSPPGHYKDGAQPRHGHPRIFPWNIGLYDEAARLALRSACDPRTLTRAARDFAEKQPDFAIEVGQALKACFHSL
jgi:hypothetical protein